MKVCVFGIGYVGVVSAACLAKAGHKVVAIDINKDKLKALDKGKSPIIEPGVQALLQAAKKLNLIGTTQSVKKAVMSTDLAWVCVGTPSLANGSLNTDYVRQVCADIGRALKDRLLLDKPKFSVVVRSTILPGTMEKIVIPALEEFSEAKAGADFGVGYFPEFLREGTAVSDFYDPGAVVYGALDKATLKRLKRLNEGIDVEPIVFDINTAEAVKYANNVWHAVKISFANEIGNIFSAQGIDSHKVMEAVCADRKLNISSAYMKPGFAFGGSCLPKDLRALRYRSRRLDIPTPIMDAAIAVNEYQVQKAYDMISQSCDRKVGFVGLTFKSDTDDLRESPLVELAEKLHGRGFKIKIFDPNVQKAELTGSNKKFINEHIPHLSKFLVPDLNSLVEQVDTVVVGVNSLGKAEMWDAINREDKNVIDLIRVNSQARTNGRYAGICW